MRVLLAHAVLDERVADAVDERRAAGGRDRSRHGPARPHVVEDGSAGLFPSITSASSAVTKSPGHELAGVVDEEAAVGVAVVGDTEIGAFLARLARR